MTRYRLSLHLSRPNETDCHVLAHEIDFFEALNEDAKDRLVAEAERLARQLVKDWEPPKRHPNMP